jgi:colanic acid/amylovoran biosynthesis protein
MPRKILVVGTSTKNKGAELMHAAIQQELEQTGDVRAVVQSNFGTPADRLRYGADAHVAPDRFKRDRLWRKLMPGSLRGALGLAWDDDVDAVIDASGFAFSDQLGAPRIRKAAEEFARWRRQGKRIVLLPQALGPFEQPEIASAMRSICQSASLIYAREKTSYEHLQKVAPDSSNLRLAPDFTCLVGRQTSALCDAPEGGFCIVPNVRMVTNTDPSVAAGYEDFLRCVIQRFQSKDVATWILVHDRGDFELARRLADSLEKQPTIWHYDDARTLKTALGRAEMVLASRFHALVSALSLGVPAVATSWSFKYQELMSDFGVPDHLVEVTGDREDVLGQFDGAWRAREQTSQALHERAAALRARARDMWREVRATLGL